MTVKRKAKSLVAAAIVRYKEVELRYRDIWKIESSIRRHFHEDVSVIVMYIDNEKAPKYSILGFTTAPIDIFAHNEDTIVEDPLLLKCHLNADCSDYRFHWEQWPKWCLL
ncbi:hypothetical protein Tco_0601939 [Tanacetum coccineum]